MLKQPGVNQQGGGGVSLLSKPLQTYYEKSNFKFFLGKFYTDNKQGQTEFQKVVSRSPIDKSYQFILNKTESIWVPIIKFVKGILSPGPNMTFDLSIIFQIFGSYEIVKSAIQFCSTSSVMVNEQKELIPFLMCCLVLNIEQPISQLNKFLSQFRDFKFILKDPSEILDLKYFCQECEINENLQHLVFGKNQEIDKSKFVFVIQEYLIANNPFFYLTRDNQLQPKIHNLSKNQFKSFLDRIYSQLFTLPEGKKHVSFESVEFFHSIIQFYYLTCQNPEENGIELVQQEFQTFYEYLIPLLKEETQIKCLPFLPDDSCGIFEILREKVVQVKEMALREKAFIHVLISQRPQGRSLEDYRNDLIQAFQIISGEEISYRVQEIIDAELNRLFQNEQQ